MNHHEDRPWLEVDGFCPICELRSRFISPVQWLRDYFRCEKCGSVPRERALMSVIQQFFPQWRSMHIHESSPSKLGLSLSLQNQCPSYTMSFYYPDVRPGELHPEKGSRCENLEQLTFPDNSFDLFITQDVFEHVFHPDLAIREIDRVLKPQGAYIMTVPIVLKNGASYRRATEKNGQIVYLSDPQYHENPIDKSGALVTIDWGYDILDYLSHHSSFKCSLIYIDDIFRGIRGEFIEVIMCRKAAVPDL